MRNTWLVIQQEIRNTLGKPSFWVTTFIFPLIIFALNIGSQVMSQQMISNEINNSDPLPGEAAEFSGYVDPAGWISRQGALPDEAYLRSYPDEAAARLALEAGEIREYYLIPENLMESGEIEKVSPRFSLIDELEQSNSFQDYLYYSLIGDVNRAQALIDPIARTRSESLSPEGKAGMDSQNILTFIVPFATLFIFFFVLTMSSTFMLQSVSQEKENRTAEVLLLSLRPRDLMLGKILGLGTVAMVQIAIWLGGGLVLLDQRALIFGAAAAFTLPPAFLIWGFFYFLLGYLLYASLLGAIGALAPSAREGGQFVFFVLLPLMIPLWLNTSFVQAPHGPLSTFLSLFPFTAPTSMMTRIAAGGVPIWQPMVGLLVLALTTYGVVLVAARFFRADTLLSTSALNWQRLRSEFKKPA